MRYANIGNYITAGRVGAAGALGALAATQASSPDFAAQQRLIHNEQAKQEILAMNLEGSGVVNAYNNKIEAARNALQASKISNDQKLVKDYQNKKRMTGMLAAASQLRKNRQDPVIPTLEPIAPDYSADLDAIAARFSNSSTIEDLQGRVDKAVEALNDFKASNATPNITSLSSMNVNYDTSDNKSFIKSALQSNPAVASQLITSEALRNTDDEYGVLANALLRVKSPQFANDLHSVVYDKGADGNTIQYAGVWGPNAVTDEKLINELLTDEGISNIDKAMSALDGRLFFKSSQDPSTGKNYKPDIDIMFAPGGNYYHN